MLDLSPRGSRVGQPDAWGVCLACASDMSEYSVPAVVRLLSSSGDILSWLLLIACLHWHLGFWDWEHYNSRSYLCWVGVSFLDFCFLSGSKANVVTVCCL